MIKYLKDLECINLERLLLLRGKELSLTDEECHILLLIDTFVTLHKKMITPSLLLKYSSLTPHEMDHILDSLLKKKWIFNKNGAICLNHFEEKLLENKEAQVEEKMNMIDVFEEQFGRPLTPMEFDSIKEWVQSGYSEEMILKALKEAVKSQVLTLRYIEGILINWAQNGVKERYIDEKPQERKVKESHYHWWEEKTNKVLDYFEELFPDAHCELNHQNVFELLVAVMLSAQTTDKKVNQVTASLFKKYPTVESFALASLEDLQDDIKIIGLYRNKAKNLKKMAQVLLEEYNGEVPKTRKELESLPGVGRKTTNVVLSVGFDEPAFAVDTHVERISKRLGFAKKDDTVNDVERKVCRSIPRDRWNKAHHQFIFFGRYFCKAQNPNCKECHLYDMCKDKIKEVRK